VSSPTPPDSADSVASLDAAEYRATVQETATSLSESLSLAQVPLTPTQSAERDRSQTLPPTLAPEPMSNGDSVQDGLVQPDRQEAGEMTLAPILLAAGLLLLVISAATTVVRIRR
jgi:hypothetical protein